MLYCTIRVRLPGRESERTAGPGGIWEQNMAISYKLEKFEGPLDLLLHLIEKNKVDIYDIPIVEITKQYLDYVNQMVLTSSGKTMKSSTFHFRGEDYHFALGINYDISVMSQMSRIMDGLLRTDATLQTSLFGTGNSMEEVFESCSEMVKRPFSQMQKADRLTLVSILKEKGFFQMQRSVPYAAERLGVTKYTIYNYLNELGGV